MFPLGVDVTKENRDEIMLRKKARHFPTHMKLLSNHNGLRRNKMHLLVAPTGVGKSTLVRTLLVDFLQNNPEMNVLLWLTEETRDDFVDEFSFALDDRTIEIASKRLKVISEQSMGMNETRNDVIKYVDEIVEHYDFDLIICDNITTSKLYLSATHTQQEQTASWLKNLCKNDLALFIIAHAGGSVQENTSKLLDENDIRGNKTLPNLAEFLYILQPMYVGNRLFQFLITKKHRGQQLHSKYIGVKYDKETSTFKESAFISFDEMKEIFKQRNRLD